MAENTGSSEHSSPASGARFDMSELTRAEYIAAMVHFYRGELHRSTVWRVRLDTTTNWAILSVMALVTFTFGAVEHSHAALVVGMLLVLTFMGIEARRYRIFNVWCARVRNLEVFFITPILQFDMKAVKQGWSRMVAEDLLHPCFNMSWTQALRARLLRNYVPLFALLLICWGVKVQPDNRADLPTFAEWVEHMRIAFVPGWSIFSFVVVLYGFLAALMFFGGRISGEEKIFGVQDNLLHEYYISEIDAAD